MAEKQKRGGGRSEATEVFRQFAWHLAGTLGGAKAVARPPARKPRPAAVGGKR